MKVQRIYSVEGGQSALCDDVAQGYVRQKTKNALAAYEFGHLLPVDDLAPVGFPEQDNWNARVLASLH